MKFSTLLVLALAFSSCPVLGCNSVLGIDQGHLVRADAATGTGTGGTLGAGGTGGAPSAPDSGASGGNAGSGGVEAGAGGRSTDGGAGGASGAGGARSDAGSGTDGGGPRTPADVPGEIRCGTETCAIALAQACCVAITTGDAHCSKSCDTSAQVTVACDGAEDCQSGLKCCYPFGQTKASCSVSCPAPGRVFCGKDTDCGQGEYCAPGTGVLETVFICTDIPKPHTVFCAGAPCDTRAGNVCCYDKVAKTEQCTSTCSGANVVRLACDGADDCTASQCCATQTGLGVFTGTACSSTCAAPAAVNCRGGGGACASGQSCCLGKGYGTSCGACTAQSTCYTTADCKNGTCDLVTDTTLGEPTGLALCQ